MKNYKVNFFFINIILMLIGIFFHVITELSILPLVTALVYFFCGIFVLSLPKLGGFWERRIYTRLFLIGFMIAGISAFFRVYLGDLQGDAESFFRNSSESMKSLSFVEISVLSEGAFAIIIWRAVFDFMAMLGFPREQYIGIFVNVGFVALSGVLALKMANCLYGYDVYRFKRLILLFSFCGLFWIFSGILLRDSVILFSVSLLTYVWLYFFQKPDIGIRFGILVISSIIAFIFFRFLRTEFFAIPIAMVIAALASLFISNKKLNKNKSIYYLLIFLGLIALGGLILFQKDNITLILLAGNQNYTKEALQQHTNNSLGISLIVGQPILLKLIFGFVYLFIFPIPFWSGFQLTSAYHFFKSINVIYFYFLIPLFILAIRKIWKNKFSQTPNMLFLLFLILGFTFAIAGTSLETRHHGVFFTFIILLALLPDLRVRIERINYKKMLTLFLYVIALIHLTWGALKVF